MQDSQKINDFVKPRTPAVASPSTILSDLPPDAKWFAIIDFALPIFQFQLKNHTHFCLLFTSRNIHGAGNLRGTLRAPPFLPGA